MLPVDEIVQGDALDVLQTWPDNSVQCVVTSPPYWGLRDYGHAGAIGLERTPEEYVRRLVDVFREVRRVLRADGTLWLNLGDCYATGGGAVGRAPGGGDQGERFIRAGMINTQPNRMPLPGLKPKDLVGIPWRVAFALQADGWYLRSDIIWAKPNPMPESVTDRPTKAHEYIFLLSKSARYFYDAEAISEVGEWCGKQLGIVRGVKVRAEAMGRQPSGNEIPGADAMSPSRRNARSVWTIATQPFSDWTEVVRWVRVSSDDVSDGTWRIASEGCPVHGHSDLRDGEHGDDSPIRNPGIDDGLDQEQKPVPSASSTSPERSFSDYTSDSPDPSCAPIARDHSSGNHRMGHAPGTTSPCTPSAEIESRTAGKSEGPASVVPHLDMPANNIWPDEMDARSWDRIASRTVGISSPCPPECTCGLYQKRTGKTSHFATFPEELARRCILAGSRPGDVVGDPFAGAGTVALVAQELGRRYVAIEIKPEYVTMARERVEAAKVKRAVDEETPERLADELPLLRDVMSGEVVG